MNKKYMDSAALFKTLSDPNRLMIVDLLSREELCACVLLERFQISQPTLSHHMKILCASKIVESRKEGKWIYYSLNNEMLRNVRELLEGVAVVKEAGALPQEDCFCGELASVAR